MTSALASGTRLGPYEVQSVLGAGGMGEVYRARDTRLDRTVAIKVLPPEVAADPERRARFEREAKAIAALSHPHICTLHDIGRHGDTAYLVMELVEGHTLADRLARGPLPVAEALRVGSEIAAALDAAHRHGIVHRDVKPANVMLTRSGAKLLDFGLAKLRARTPVVLGASAQTTTAAAPGTAEGSILGTVHYMAPEQVEGKDADHRADIWALGAVLYEMVSGVRPFTGDTAASVIGAILKDTPPPLASRRPLSPAALDAIVAGCLAKDPDERWQSAADVGRQLRGVIAHAAGPAPAAAALTRTPPWNTAAVALASAALAAAGVFVGVRPRSPAAAPAPAATVTRFQLTLPPNLTFVAEQPPAVSPDGQRLALVAFDRESNRRQIYLRALGGLTAQTVSGTQDAQYPFWSPDGRKLAFFSHSRLRTVDLDSGSVQDVAPMPNPGGPGIWSGQELFIPRSTGPVVKVPAAGGTPTNAATFDAMREVNQSIAGVLPDGRLLVASQAGLFLVQPGGAMTLVSASIVMPATLMPPPGGDAHAPGLVAFVSNGRLMAQRLNDDLSATAGTPVELASETSRLVTQSARPFSASANVLAFTSRSDMQTRPTWVSRSGEILGPAASLSGQLRDLRLSPDGRAISVSRFTAQGRFELILIDMQRDTALRLAPQLSFQQSSWWPDGRALIGVGQEGSGARAIYRVAAAEGAVPERILGPGTTTFNNPQLSPDGTTLSYAHADPEGNFDIYVRPLRGEGEGRAIVSSESYDSGGRISPDGRWILYHSDETGVLNVFIRSFPDGKDKLQVSLDGGQRPSWGRDGREVYYLADDGGLMAATLAPGAALTVSRRERLFTAPLDPTFGTPGASLYDSAPGGQRFLMLVPTAATPQPVTVVLNWPSLLAAR